MGRAWGLWMVGLPRSITCLFLQERLPDVLASPHGQPREVGHSQLCCPWEGCGELGISRLSVCLLGLCIVLALPGWFSPSQMFLLPAPLPSSTLHQSGATTSCAPGVGLFCWLVLPQPACSCSQLPCLPSSPGCSTLCRKPSCAQLHCAQLHCSNWRPPILPAILPCDSWGLGLWIGTGELYIVVHKCRRFVYCVCLCCALVALLGGLCPSRAI